MERGELCDRLRRGLGGFHEIRLAYLFGSRATERVRQESDIDVAILVDEAAARDVSAEVSLIRRLAGRLGREVSSDLLDVVILNRASQVLCYRVLRDGVLLYERSQEERVQFFVRTVRELHDSEHRRGKLTEWRIERLRGGLTHGGERGLLDEARGVAPLLGEAEGAS
ncbi:nucleotidyltransferase domain-containing protein [Planctomycetota bacterium]